MKRGYSGIGNFVGGPPTNVYFVDITRSLDCTNNTFRHYARVNFQSVGVKHVSGSGYSPRIRQDLYTNRFDIAKLNIDDTVNMCIEYNESTDAYCCKFMIKSKDISNYVTTPTYRFGTNASSTRSWENIRNWKMKLNFDEYRYYYALASPNCKCNDINTNGFHLNQMHNESTTELGSVKTTVWTMSENILCEMNFLLTSA